MLKTHLIWLSLFGYALSIASASLEITAPLNLRGWWTSNPDGTSESIAQFGDIPWGSSITGQIRLANPINACSTIQINATSGSVPTILIAMRGECPFTVKAKNAEETGAKLLLVVDNQYEDVTTKLMVDNSGGAVPIHIASVLIAKQGGEKLIEAVQESEAGASPVSGTYIFANPTQESVNYHIWLLNGERKSFEFLQDFKQYYDKISSLATMRIHFPTLPHQENLHCTCQGRYCTPWQEGDLFKLGAEVITENVKQLCILKHLGQDAWWEYVIGFANSCLDSQNTAECSESIIQKMNIDFNDVRSCLTESFHFGSQGCESNPLLDQEFDEQVKDGPIVFPEVIINGFQYRGNMIPAKGVFSAICQSFNMMPEICNIALNLTESNNPGSDVPKPTQTNISLPNGFPSNMTLPLPFTNISGSNNPAPNPTNISLPTGFPSNITLPFPLTNTSEPPKVPSPEEIVKALPPGTLPSLPTSYQGNPSAPVGSETASSRESIGEPSSHKDGSARDDNVTITVSKTDLVIIFAVIFCVVFALIVLFLHRRSIKRLEAIIQANKQNRAANLPYAVLGNNPPQAEAHSSSYQA